MHLILHACVRRFDVMGAVENFLGTKHPLFKTRVAAVTYMSISCFIIITLMYSEKHLNMIAGWARLEYCSPSSPSLTSPNWAAPPRKPNGLLIHVLLLLLDL